jgi:site-specific recombinase XerD
VSSATTKGRRFPPEVLTHDETRALMGACSPSAPTGVRNKALIAVLWRSGLRVGEALALMPSDIDAKANTVRVAEGKGGKHRVVGIDDEALALVGRWQEVRASKGIGGRRTLFCTLKGGPVSSRYVRTMLRRLARKGGVERRVHPHAFRHTFSAELVQEGQSLDVVQQSLGHGSVTTTAKYLRRIAPANLVEVARNRPRWS